MGEGEGDGEDAWRTTDVLTDARQGIVRQAYLLQKWQGKGTAMSEVMSEGRLLDTLPWCYAVAASLRLCFAPPYLLPNCAAQSALVF